MKVSTLPLVHRDLVFVIDDEDALRTILARKLEKAGWRVETYASPPPALERMREVLPSVVISDLVMPRMTGLEFLREIREQHGPDLPAFVLMTAHSSAESARDALRLGASDYIMKPFDPRDMLDRVARAAASVDAAIGRAVLSSVLADDLRAPLGALEMSLHALERDEAGPLSEEQRELVHLARTECGRLHRLVHNLDDLALLERGDMHTRPDRLRLDEVVREAAARLKDRLLDDESATVLVSHAPAGGELSLHADRQLLLRMFECLLMAGRGDEGQPAQAELQMERRNGTVRMELGPLVAVPGASGTGSAAALEPGARRQLLDGGIRINMEMELSFAQAAVGALGGEMRIESDEQSSRVIVELPAAAGGTP